MTEVNPVYMRHVYGVGSITNVAQGKLKEFTDSFSEVQKKFVSLADYSGILMPNAIGAYLITFKNPFLRNEIPRSDLEEMSVEDLKEIFDKEDSLVFDFEMAPHPFLTQVGYDPKVMSAEVVGSFLNDFSSRIKVLPYDKMNTESEKMKKYLSRVEAIDMGSEEDPNPNGTDPNKYFTAVNELMMFGGIDQELDLLLALKRDMGINPFDPAFS